MTAPHHAPRAPIRVVGAAPPYPLCLRLDDGRELDFDADHFPIRGGDPRGIATRIVSTLARDGRTVMTGWAIDPDGSRHRALVECAGILWIDDRRDLAGATNEAVP